ncbi:MAG: NAD(P)/FAD-dependent oxidoreductase [Planctomycetes bacterium]|nr:NAD(P)/FAD-dependent oxidoreductase [Planctomycetota bacterium]
MASKKMNPVVVGAGAAGLATAIFAARRNPGREILLIDSARKIGAKILVSGGGRCNVTNEVVAPADFRGGSSNVVRRVLNSFPVEKTVSFFREIGVALHAEPPEGKLFPDTNRARTVLDALVTEAERRGVRLVTEFPVREVRRRDEGFELVGPDRTIFARTVVLATGGRSLPKTGSDGTGYRLAQSLGHTTIPTTPALEPLMLEGDFHAALTGISQEAEVVVRVESEKPFRARGSLLWTHLGASGPAVLDASRVWRRARLEGRPVTVCANLLPGDDFESADRRLLGLTGEQPRAMLRNALAALLPARVAQAVLDRLKIEGEMQMAQLPRESRRTLVRALLDWPLPVRDGRGWNYAEVTAGGVPLGEINPATMASRKCPGLHLVGEILDVDGRIGGFNFQWAWSSGWVAGQAI